MKKNIKVRKALLETGMTHSQLAKLLGMSQPSLSMAISTFELAASEQNRLVRVIREGAESRAG